MAETRNLIGRQVRLARERSRPPLTQAELTALLATQRVRLGRVGISKVENGTRAVTDIELVALSAALGVSISWLLEPEAQ